MNDCKSNPFYFSNIGDSDLVSYSTAKNKFINKASDSIITESPTVNALVNATYITKDAEPELPNSRVLAVDTTQLELTDDGVNNNLTVSFPSTAPPQTSFAPSLGNHLTNLTALQTITLSSFGQSDAITSILNAKYPNTRHIWYNKLAIASSCSFWINSGETMPAIEITMTTKPTMPVWPVYMSLFQGTFTAIQDTGFFMLPPPGMTKTYTRLLTQQPGTRNTAAGTYTSLWDNTTTNVLASSTAVLSCDGAAGTQWGITWGLCVGTGTTQIIENFDTITTGAFANINILTDPNASEYFSAIQIRGRY